ncbi:hypothetical protein ABZ567_14730 [Streptomyces sp. NPDC016459]|uniref:hypothetical protein n=1 Tax=Streptomyces sp. NPDC016459 TaxID=3157190 RepID=UPI003404E483
MSKTEHETDPRGTLACPVCKQPVSTTVKGRHKTLGVFVPVWRPGPCHNAECPASTEAPAPTPHKTP